jgi:hypothetical protein
MRLDHISYATSHNQISDVVNRIGSQIGTAFIDGGIHPKFGTRNFTAPLLNGQYIEVVCPLEHPATDLTPFGQAVKKKAEEGGGWLAWVISTNNISEIETRLKRKAVNGNRTLPNNTQLKWKQIGVLATIDNPTLPFFVQWISDKHPSKSSLAQSKIQKIYFTGTPEEIIKWVGDDSFNFAGEIELTWSSGMIDQDFNCISKIEFNYNSKTVTIY